jgi:hypothetical protein
MPLGYDFEGEDEKPTDIEKMVGNELWGDRNNPWHAEYEGDHDESAAEFQKLKESQLGDWDKMISESERREIAELNPELYNWCPHLTQAGGGSDSFYFCMLLAGDFITRTDLGVGFTRLEATKKSAEWLSRCNSDDLRAHCIGDCFEQCEVYYAHENWDEDRINREMDDSVNSFFSENSKPE